MSFGKKYRFFFGYLFLLLTKICSSTLPNVFCTAWSIWKRSNDMFLDDSDEAKEIKVV